MTMELDFSTTRHVFNPFLLTSALIPEPRAAFCQWFEDFGRRLAPADLGNVPLYVVDAALAGPGDTLGFAGESLDLAYQEQIGQRWRGRGACFAVDLQQVQDQADIETPNEEARKAGFIRQALALALHEFAHVLSQAKLFSQGVTQSAARQSATRCLQTPDEDTPGGDVAWVGHDGQFLRTVAHVEHRARALLGSPVQAYAVAGLHLRTIPARSLPPGTRRRARKNWPASRLPRSCRRARRNPSSTYGKPTWSRLDAPLALDPFPGPLR